MNSVLIVAGESSGERYGADVVRDFKAINSSFSFFGIGGKRMEEAGVELLFSVQDLSGIGIVEVITHLPRFKRIFERLKKEIDSRRPQAALLIDCPDFNLRLAKRLKKIGVPVLYYISPTVWAWRSRRLKTIKKCVTRMLLIFPFEKKIYDRHGIPAVYVGHPLRYRVGTRLSRSEFLTKHSLPPDRKIISLLPGSRETEIKNHLGVLLEAVRIWRHNLPAAVFLLLLAESIGPDKLLRHGLGENEDIRVLREDGNEALAYSDLVLSACGTANLEAALLEAPLLAFYRLSPFTYYPFRGLVKIKDYSIVNILAGKRIVPELIQRRFSAENLVFEARNLLFSETKRAEMRKEFQRLKNFLGEAQASAGVARELEKIVAAVNPEESEGG